MLLEHEQRSECKQNIFLHLLGVLNFALSHCLSVTTCLKHDPVKSAPPPPTRLTASLPKTAVSCFQ